MTAMVRDVALRYHGEVEIDFNTTCPDLWRHNPYITRLWNHDHNAPKTLKTGVRFVKLDYQPGLREQNRRTVHFAAYFHEVFTKETGLPVTPTAPHGDLHLSEYEKHTPLIDQRYWVVLSGGKSDAPIKVWDWKKLQIVVNDLRKMGLGAVQIGDNDPGHWHPPLDNVLNLVGRTNLRDMLRLIHHADGVICGVTGAMHMAAALHRPCVVWGAGREAWWWEAYVNENRGFGPTVSGKHPMPHRYLHTIGLLDCCEHHGCWRNHVVPRPGTKKNPNAVDRACRRPVLLDHMPVPECLHLITPAHVIDAVSSYYTDHSLPPISRRPQPDGYQDPPPQLLPQTRLETRGPNRPQAVAVAPYQPAPPLTANQSLLDHPDVGSKVTACVLLYSDAADDYYDTHRRCLDTLIATVPDKRLDLRVGSNCLGDRSLQYVESLVAAGDISRHYRHTENAYKYPVMREMFFDPTHPLVTKWVLWFDDDSICDVEQNWLHFLAEEIVKYHRRDNAHVFGARMTWRANEAQRKILQQRPWYKRRPWRTKAGVPATTGSYIIFPVGGFWAATAECIRKADIPDLGTGLTHNGGDWQIGEQVYQAGFGIRQFNGRKQFVRTSSVARRGVTMPMIGSTKPAVPPPIQPATPPDPAARFYRPPPLVSAPEKPALPREVDVR